MTPVESTRTSSVFRSSSRAASALVARASSLPRSPVAEFATPELIDDRLRLGLPDVVAVHGQAGGLDLVAAEHRRARLQAR